MEAAFIGLRNTLFGPVQGIAMVERELAYHLEDIDHYIRELENYMDRLRFIREEIDNDIKRLHELPVQVKEQDHE